MALFSKKKDSAQKAAAPTKKATAKKKRTHRVATSPFAHVLLAPVVTEKAYRLSEQGKYVFRVRSDATKAQVRRAVMDLYGVDVTKVHVTRKKQQRTMFRGVKGTTKTQKKAIVTVAAGAKIDLFE